MKICFRDWQELLDAVKGIAAQLKSQQFTINAIHYQGTKMSAELDRLTTEVTETSGAVDSALALIAGLADQIRALSTDPAALTALADSLDAQQAKIAAAVAANPTP